MQGIRVTAPAHLHAGNMDLTGDIGRLYGTAGFTLERPRTVVEARRSAKLAVDGEDKENARIYARRFIERYGIKGGAKITVKESIPRHLGMGSQTALALSVATALSDLYCLRPDMEAVALALGRSDIVGLGFHSFRRGGFIVDGGYVINAKGKKVPPLIFSRPIPGDWLFVVCIPSRPIPKILEIKADEEKILLGLEKMPAELSDRLSRIMLMQVMPSMAEGDIESFGKAVTAFNGRLGGFWKGFQQGNTYCDPIVEDAIKAMLEYGAYGACQTCWGPTCYGLFDDLAKAERTVKKLEELLSGRGGGRVFISGGNNSGALEERW